MFFYPSHTRLILVCKGNLEDVKTYFLRVMAEFHSNERITKGENSSFKALIPKKKNSLRDFIPISLVGCTYKMVSKLLANRIKTVIGLVIFES